MSARYFENVKANKLIRNTEADKMAWDLHLTKNMVGAWEMFPPNAGADLDRFMRFAQTCQIFSQKFFLECFL